MQGIEPGHLILAPTRCASPGNHLISLHYSFFHYKIVAMTLPTSHGSVIRKMSKDKCAFECAWHKISTNSISLML